MDYYSILQQRAKIQPNDIAYTFLPDQHRQIDITNQALLNAVRTVSACLTSKTNNTPIILLFNPGVRFVCALFGCLASGNIAVPIAMPKPQQLPLLKKIIKNSKAEIILSETLLIERFSNELKDCMWLDYDEALAFPINSKPSSSNPDDIAILQYTSGSTGTPKGVMVSFKNLEHNIRAVVNHFSLSEKSISFSWLPHYHDMGLIDGILQPVFVGCRGIITSPRQVIGRPEFWFDCITKFKVTHTGGPNFFYELCNEKVHENKNWDLSSLSALYVSAEPVRNKTLELFSRKFKSVGLSKNVFAPGYGLAESTLMVSCKEISDPIRTNSFLLSSGKLEAVSLGRLIPGMRAKIVDVETNEEVRDEQPGELWLQGDSVTNGYWNNVNETQNNYEFTDSEEHWLKTGDIGIFKDEELYMVGRLKDLIILNGANYYAEDLEYSIEKNIKTLQRGSCLAFSIENEIKEELVILIKVEKLSNKALTAIVDNVRNILYHQFGLGEVLIYFHHGPAYAKTTSGKIRRSYNKELFLLDKFRLLPIVK